MLLQRENTMEPVVLLLILATWWTPGPAAYSGPLQPEMSNGTFHHFFVPDGDYEETVDPEQCQMLFKFSSAAPCGAAEGLEVREELVLCRMQAEDAARTLERIGRTVAQDLDGEQSYGSFLQREISQISEAFSNVDKSLLELEVKFKQSEESEEQQLDVHVLQHVSGIGGALRDSKDIFLGLRDKQDLLALIIRSHGTRLSRLKTQYLFADS